MVDNEFVYKAFENNNWPLDIISYKDIPLVNIESKHVAHRNENTDIYFELSKKVGYKNTILGIHRTTSIENEYFRIQNMSKASCLRAVRFVITNDGRIWSDNTHWTLSYIYRYGKSTLISDIPFYIIDFRNNLPIVYDCQGVVFDSISDIRKAILAAKSIQERVFAGWRPATISYKIEDLYCDLENIILQVAQQ